VHTQPTGLSGRVRGTAAIRIAVGIRNAGGEHAVVAAVRHDDQSLAHMLRLMQGLFLKGASVASLAQDW